MHHLDEAIAKHLFGWKWVSFMGVPIRDTENYPDKCRVRLFISEENLRHSEWQKFINKPKNEFRHEATGAEPLDYCYCSSQGYPVPPSFAGNETACFQRLIPAMEARGYTFSLVRHAEGRGLYFAEFDKKHRWFRHHCKSASEAICQAAVKALEGEEK